MTENRNSWVSDRQVALLAAAITWAGINTAHNNTDAVTRTANVLLRWLQE